MELPRRELLHVIEQKGWQVEIRFLAEAVLLPEEHPHLFGMLQNMNKEIKMNGNHEGRSNEKKTEKWDVDIDYGEPDCAWHQQHLVGSRGHRD